MNNKQYILFWLHGRKETVTGATIEQAITNAGYGSGAMRALDFYAPIERADDWVWDEEKKSWDSLTLIKAYGR